MLLSFLPVVSCSHFSPCDPFCLARFPRGSHGCSPHSSTASRRPQMRSVFHTDPPSVSTMSCVYSTHHFVRALNSFFLVFNAFLLRCHLLFFSMPFLSLNFSFFLASLLLSLCFSFLILLSPPLLQRLLRSPLRFLSRLLRSPLLLSRLLRSPLLFLRLLRPPLLLSRLLRSPLLFLRLLRSPLLFKRLALAPSAL